MKTATVDCHPTAVIHEGAQLEEGVRIGPYCVVGEHVQLGRGTVIEASAVIDGYTRIGEGCRIFPFSSIGLEPQDLKFKGEVSTLEIGNDNVFREFVTVHRGTALGGSRTAVGNGNLFMAYTHIAHDCVIGNSTIFGNGATLGGHVSVDDHATVSAFSGVHQFCRVGKYAFVGGYTVVTKDVLPFSKTVGNRARLYGVNSIGLERRDFPRDRIEKIRWAFRVLRQSNLNVSQALDKLQESQDDEDVRTLIDFVKSSERGVIVKRGREEND
ncbi:MAG: acyl-ACP--UDP-N-acetylglucosamine O-acyltransferase [Acidobacteriota bacterium]|nr:MAG: acyl-ACP--UDP-N-acetylglucosamine O-acyltransferase [Acidobacteriota bacterium]